jgi:hypothetical protein
LKRDNFSSTDVAGEPRRPLDALKAGQIEDVIHAIRFHGEAFT